MDAELFADYFQIYILDEESQSDLADVWTHDAIRGRLAAMPGLLGIWTEVNDFVDVSIELIASRPEPALDSADHVVEGSIEAASGRLVVMGCTDYLPDAPRLTVPAGWLRARVSKSNIDAALSSDTGEDDDPAESERIVIKVWPEERSEVKVLKLWQAATGSQVT